MQHVEPTHIIAKPARDMQGGTYDGMPNDGRSVPYQPTWRTAPARGMPTLQARAQGTTWRFNLT